MKAFVAGATGQTGKQIVQALVERGIPVRALVRNLETAKALLPKEAELVVGDVIKSETLVSTIADSTVLLCATGARPSLNFTEPFSVDYLGTNNLVNAAKALGVEQFILVSSLCVSKFFHPLNLFWLVLFWKKMAEGYLANSGLTYTIVRPGGLKNQDNTTGITMSSADTLFEGSIPRQKVAQVCVESLFQPNARNKIIEIVSSAESTQSDWLDLFAGVS